MKILADESVDGFIVERLRQEGHEIEYAVSLFAGADDDIVLNHANAGGFLLLTADKDFGELVFRHGLVHSGVMLLRLAGISETKKAEIVSKVFSERIGLLAGAFSVVSPNAVRIRQHS